MFLAESTASGPVFMFCALELIFGGIEGVEFRFHVLRARTRFRRYRGCRVPFSRFALLNMFSAVPRASGLVFMFCAPGLVFVGTEDIGSRFLVFCAPGLVFGSTEGVLSHFHVLRSRTRFRRYRGCWVSFLCFALPNSFSAVPRASYPVFLFSAHRHVFGGTEGVRSIFHVLCARTYFRPYRGRRVAFSCFARTDLLSTVPRASGPVFNFCAPGICSRRYRGHRVPFSCFALPDSFSAVPKASGPVFMFCTPGLIFGGTEGVRSLFHVFRSQTHFRRYRGRRVPFLCFALPESFPAVPRSLASFFMFCAPGFVFGGIEGVRSLFLVLRSRTHFRRYRGH
jgi:hypothetical protein